MSGCSWLFNSTQRMVGRVAASAIPSASRSSFISRLDVGPHIFRRHEPDVMSLACEQTAEMMRATASFHGDDAGWELGNQTDQRFSLRSPAQNDRARCVETDDTANILAEID